MPELPEVTTIVNGLNAKTKGLAIKDVWTDCPKLIKNSSFENFRKTLRGKKIENSERIGKNILMHLSGGVSILFHMKMTGHLLFGKWVRTKIPSACHSRPRSQSRVNSGGNPGKSIWKPEEKDTPLCDPYNRFVHIIFYFTDGNMLALSDMRKFAKIAIGKTGDEKSFSEIKKLGPDALKISFTGFKERLTEKPSGKIKQVLMDQGVVAGIGNIYSDEILWASGVHPKEKIKNIPEQKMRKIYASAKNILKLSIKYGGDSMSDFRNIKGEKGNYQKYHKAYRRTGEPCPKKDGGKIVRIKVGGRSAHYCDKHQKLFE